MPQSARLRAEFVRRFGPILRARQQEVVERLGGSPEAIRAAFEALYAEMRQTAQDENAAFVFSEKPGFDVEVRKFLMAGQLLQPVLDSLSEEIHKSANRSQNSIPAETFAGVLPTGAFNAQATAAGGGYLILVNDGLLMFVHQVTKIMAFALRFHDFDNAGRLIEHPEMGFATHTLDEIRAALSEVVYAYLAFEYSAAASRFPAQGGIRGMVASLLRWFVELFAVAHEYGHLIGGHVSPEWTKRLEVAGSDVDVLAKKRTDEFEADHLGAQLLIGASGVASNPALSMSAVAGPLIFFELDSLITRVQLDVFGSDRRVVIDHPPSNERAESLRPLFEETFGSDAFGLADPAVYWIRETSDDVVSRIGHVVGRGQ
jgi:hypothetical protein